MIPGWLELLTWRAKDEVIDLAALKVKEKTKLPLPAMPLGSSEAVKTGDWTIVLGTLYFTLFYYMHSFCILLSNSFVNWETEIVFCFCARIGAQLDW